MVSIREVSLPPLQGLLDCIWAHEPPRAQGSHASHAQREHVLPTGAVHIVVRQGGPAIRVFDHDGDERGHRFGWAVVGGPRTTYHVRDVCTPAASIGAVLKPGACRVLLGVPESALAGHHTALDQLLPPSEVEGLIDLLDRGASARARLDVFQGWLAHRAQGQAPDCSERLAAVLQRTWRPEDRVEDLVRSSGWSHRHFIDAFRQVTGLQPHHWLRLRRFSSAIDLAASSDKGWAEIAAACGFADQAHLARTFRTIAGVTASDWRRCADPASPRHVAR